MPNKDREHFIATGQGFWGKFLPALLNHPQGKAALDKIMEEERAAFNKMIQGDLRPEKK